MLQGAKRISFVVTLVVTTLPSVAVSATFDLHFRPYCATADCGHQSRAEYERFICAAVEERFFP